MMVHEREILQYLTDKYSERKQPVQKNWTFQEHFNFVDEELEEMLIDLFTRYNIRYDGFNLYHYFEPERPWWKGKPPERKLKPLTVEMIIESARAGVWLYE
ncbi:DUF1493 family protein [Raoultella terrigena]|nr:DUF1493 family protein [Raoultella terrigena]